MTDRFTPEQKEEIRVKAIVFLKEKPMTAIELTRRITNATTEDINELLRTDEQHRFLIPQTREKPWELSEAGHVFTKTQPLPSKTDILPKVNDNLSSLIKNLQEASSYFTDKRLMAQHFLEIQPVYYDDNKMFWLWSNEKNCWIMVDETDLLNLVNANIQGDTINQKERNTIIEALKQVGRQNRPKDMPKTWIQFKNKIVDIATGLEHPISSEWFSVNPIPWSIVDSDETPEFDKLYSEWVEKEFVDTLFEIQAFCLVPDYFIQRAISFCGSGSNGKGVFQEITVKLVGENNAVSSELERLSFSRFESSKMYRKLVCVMGETNFGSFNKTGTFKRLTGRDLMDYEFKNKTPFTERNYAKLLINTNSLPQTNDNTDGFHRRWLIIDFPNKFTEKRQIMEELNDDCFDRLATKCLNILRKLWVEREFTGEGTIEERRKRYEERSNPTGKFVKEFFIKDINGKVPYGEFYSQLQEYLLENGHRVISRKELTKVLSVLGLETTKDNTKKEDGTNTKKTYIHGINWIGDENSTNSTDSTDVSLSSLRCKLSGNSGSIGTIGTFLTKKSPKNGVPLETKVLEKIKETQEGIKISLLLDWADGSKIDVEDLHNTIQKLLSDGLIFENPAGQLKSI